MLDQKQCKNLLSGVLKFSRADEVFVSITSNQDCNIRFARNAPSTCGQHNDHVISVRSTFGNRSGTASNNQLDGASLAEVVARSEQAARLAPHDPEHMALLGPQQYAAPEGYDRNVLEQGFERTAGGAKTCLDISARRGLVSAGIITGRARVSAIGNSRGLFGFYKDSEVIYSQTNRTPDGTGSGWASAVGTRFEDIDFAKKATIACDKALASRQARSLKPGKYTAILEPACVASLLSLLFRSLSRRAADEGRNVFSAPDNNNRLGEQLFDKRVTIYSDPLDVRAPSVPWGQDGLPQCVRKWVHQGKLTNLATDRFWAQKKGIQPIPYGSNMLMKGGSSQLPNMIADIKQGVLITSFWYIRSVDPKTLLYTGLTRDGVFWIEDGQIAYPLNNFRWNNSLIAVFKNVLALGPAERVAPRSRYLSNVVVPPLCVHDFELSSVSKAV